MLRPVRTIGVSGAGWRWGLSLLLAACASASERAGTAISSASGKPNACPEHVALNGLPPGTRPEHMQLDYWLQRYPAAELDEPLLSEQDVQAYDASVARGTDPLLGQRDLLQPVDRAAFQRELDERVQYMRSRIEAGRYRQRSGSALSSSAQASFNAQLPELRPELRVALDVVPIRCGPFNDALFEQKPEASAPSLGYDRNACSSARPQEVVQVLATWPDSSLLVRTRFALGWIDAAAPLSPAIPKPLQIAFVRGPRLRAAADRELADAAGKRYSVPKHTTLPQLAGGRVSLAHAKGFEAVGAQGLDATRRPLTRRALLTTGFQFLDSRYGFGDAEGGRDCSRFQMDLFESFDIALPRHSGWQAKAGNATLDVAGMPAADKLRTIEQLAARGAVLMALPGHIMLYLGKDQGGVPMALHALGEYAVACADGQADTVVDVQRTVVSDLNLGAGSHRGALIDRITALAVFGRGAAPEPKSSAQLRPLPPTTLPSSCHDSVEARIFHSPARPVVGQPLRWIATTPEPVSAAALWVYNPHGELEQAPPHPLGGPPHAVWARVEAAARGRYTAVFADGERVLACTRVVVGAQAQPASGAADPMVWTPRASWAKDTLGLWSAFVEQLFDGPPDDEQTWTNLHTLLRDPERNLLLDHLGLGEDAALEVQPDCADLPYSLRAYFAWKLALPFAYRQCSRGQPKVPPSCGPLITDLQPRATGEGAGARSAIAAFDTFLNRGVRWGVHSGTGRTHPEDPETDLYPVALERPSLPPGTVYADPYGHVLMVAKWFPQGKAIDAYGTLLGAEAQPDGTIGRRRFFPGSFLFDPATTDAGAGFKQFRPLRYDPKAGAISVVENGELAKSPVFAHFSMQQYRGSKDDFYDAMDRLINPAPLDVKARLTSLVEALEESARRRVLAVDNGEQYFAHGGKGPIAMPKGYEIFETEGAWEDFATPSRDMRLLIAIDTVLALPKQLERSPERFKLTAAQAPAAAQALKADMERELSARTISYTGSDGAAHSLSLQTLRERADRLEVAYNPNDCVEVRWGAPEGSDEAAACRRHAPPEQRARLERYRSWFHDRVRPPRGQGR